MTGPDFRALRLRLGLSRPQLAPVLRVTAHAVKKWESGATSVSGPATVLMLWLTSGRRPKLPEPREGDGRVR